MLLSVVYVCKTNDESFLMSLGGVCPPGHCETCARANLSISYFVILLMNQRVTGTFPCQPVYFHRLP
jgi:hypothetical protein